MNDCTANILIVDDDEKSLFAIESLLAAPRRNIVKAASGAEALRALLREEFAVILLDVRMPQMDGFETAELIRQRERLRRVPIIFLSGIDTLETDVLRGVSSGAVDYLFKPVIPKVLQSKVGVFVDLYRLTEEVKRQAIRQESEQWHRELVEALPTAIYTTDADGVITHFNQAAVELWGQQPPPGTRWCGSPKLFNPDGTPLPHEKCPMARALKEDRAVLGTEIILERPDGARVPILPYPTPLHSTSGTLIGAVNMLVDITRRKHAEDELKRFNAELEQRVEERTAELIQAVAQREKLREQLLHAQKMESVGTLASGVAHDFNNLLNIIAGYTAALERQSNDQAKQAESLKVMRETTQRGASLVQQLMSLGRKADLKRSSVNLNGILESLESLVKETFPKTILTEFSLESSLSNTSGEPDQLNQVFLNLCLNARDAMPNGGRLRVTTEIITGRELRRHFREAREERYISVSISDTGTGMDDATVKRIFEPFFTTKPLGQGTGLGLSVVYGIVTSHGGFVAAESAPGQGTTLRVYLPVFAAEDSQGLEPKTKLYFPPPGGKGETILFVDDEENQLRLMRWFFETEGYKMLAARDGLEAVELHQKHMSEIAVVILDLGLPKLNGWEAFQKMRELQPDMKALIATGFVSPEIEGEITKSKIGGVVLKPYQLDDILEKVAAMIQGRGEEVKGIKVSAA